MTTIQSEGEKLDVKEGKHERGAEDAPCAGLSGETLSEFQALC